jgi:outer membrane protein OmpA-like peptidoglycan-associated protein
VHTISTVACIVGTAGLLLSTDSRGQGGAGATPAQERVDYLTFAAGAVPLRIEGAGAQAGANYERAVRIIDGSAQGFTLTAKPVSEAADTVFVYELPAPTTFDRFAVPNVLETPAPNQTFTRTVAIDGSSVSATDGFELLASSVLATHKSRGLVTDLPVVAKKPVRWVRLRLGGGINVMRPDMFFEFSEIVGNGTQEPPQPVTHFTGGWRRMALRLQLEQKGVVVSGCYDRGGDLEGTVTGNILRATGVNRFDKTPSAFILTRAENGSLHGVRSDNKGPFRYFTVDVAPAGTPLECGEPAPPALGCDSVVHGINFDFDSAVIRPESDAVLASLYAGLAGETGRKIVIEGHTSSEGADDYNLGLSQRRAQAVVADLVRRGVAASRIAAAGRGETQPIASNDDESGRSLNRRVEVKCQ